MKISHIALVLFLSLSSLTLISANWNDLTETKEDMITVHQDSVLRHMVLFKFNDSTSTQKINEIEQAFKALPSKIPEIHAYEWGLNNSPEGLDKGFTHCFFITFKSEEDRAAYLPNPDHQAFVALLEGHIADVLVVDYWATN